MKSSREGKGNVFAQPAVEPQPSALELKQAIQSLSTSVQAEFAKQTKLIDTLTETVTSLRLTGHSLEQVRLSLHSEPKRGDSLSERVNEFGLFCNLSLHAG